VAVEVFNHGGAEVEAGFALHPMARGYAAAVAEMDVPEGGGLEVLAWPTDTGGEAQSVREALCAYCG